MLIFATTIIPTIMKTIDQIVGSNLKKLRELFKETQDSFAFKTGVSRSAYANYESGAREIPYDVIEKAAVIFGCEPYILFDENISTENDVLACAFRVDGISSNDFEEVCRFKEVVRSYLKMNRIANG